MAQTSSLSLRAQKIPSVSLPRPLASAVAATSRRGPAPAASGSPAAPRCRVQTPTPHRSSALLATAFEFARETPRLRINAVEPGFKPATALGREANAVDRGREHQLSRSVGQIRNEAARKGTHPSPHWTAGKGDLFETSACAHYH
jgi:hypothetical protein